MRASVRRCSPVARLGPTTPKMISTVLVVDRVELDAPRAEQQRPGLRLGGIERAVRNRDAVADAGALEVLALDEQLLDDLRDRPRATGDSISASRRSASGFCFTKLPSTSTKIRSTFKMSESRMTLRR